MNNLNEETRPLKKVMIKTWGCQMNVYDSSRMADVLRPLGYAPTQEPSEADLVILNTCHIREKASEKLFSVLGRLHEEQLARGRQGRRLMIAVAGCVAQAEGPLIKARAPYVDMIFGPQAYARLPEMIARATRQAGLVLETDFPPEPKFDHLPARDAVSEVTSFLSIQEGCDRFCSYCVVPYTRGAEYARGARAIEDEARALAARGVREITLLGQNVNAWRDDKGGLGSLIRRLAKIDGIARLRYTTSHPLSMDEDLIAAHGDEPKLMPFLHLPAQSGSDAILKAMNRKYTAAEYLRSVEKLRAARPDIALSSDFIVGFPGETDADFNATMRLVEEVGYAQAFSFKYSRRPGTPAAALQAQVEEAVKDARLTELQALLRVQQEAFNKKAQGQEMSVLIEEAKPEEGRFFGRTPYLQAVQVHGEGGLVGQEVRVKIDAARLVSLTGTLCS